jgi:hypothetical protein
MRYSAMFWGRFEGTPQRNGGTWGHWRVATAYAKYLDKDFAFQVQTGVGERLEKYALGAG